MVSVPVLLPAAEGSKKTPIVQLAPGARVLVQPLVSPKSALACTPVMVSGASPVLLSVTFCGRPVVPTNWLAKLRLAGDRLTTGAMPVPLRAAICGLPEALSVTTSAAERAPRALGLKVTLIVQLAPAARLVPQLLLRAKSLLFGPVIATPLIFSAWLPVLESVTGWAGLAVPTS